VPDAKVTGVIGRKTSFEITLNGNLIYSKLKTDKFPEDAEIVAIVKKEAEATK
jgi:selT/selW/selH-like putative selenoprotein